jgi:isopentenyldiphosphate isomerase
MYDICLHRSTIVRWMLSKKRISIVLGGLIIVFGLKYCLSPRKNLRGIELIDRSHDGFLNVSTQSQISIDLAHRHKIPHRGVWIFVLNSDHQVLFVKRSPETITCPNTWTSIGEHTHFLESYESAALRGLREELLISKAELMNFTSLGDRNPSLYEINYPSRRTDLQWTRSFLAIVSSATQIRPNLETSRMEWISLKDASDWLNKCPGGICRTCVVSSFTVRSSDGVKGTSFLEILQEQIHLISEYVSRST